MNCIKQLQNKLKPNQCAVILSPYNRLYFTEFESSEGLLIVAAKNVELYVDFRYIEAAKKKLNSDILVKLKQQDNLFYIEQFIKQNSINLLFVEGDFINAAFYAKLVNNLKDIVNIDINLDVINEFRAVKNNNQLEKIKSAQAITDRVYSQILNDIRIGISERQLKSRIIYLLYKYGADGLSFEPIVVSGENSSLPHGAATDRIITAGDFVTIDFGAIKDGWCADMTRTVAMQFVDDEHLKVYQTVLEAHNLAKQKVKAGILCSDVDKAARQYIDDNGYKGYFGHSTGHGVGVVVHELPNISSKNNTSLQAGNVITIEPGIYLDNRFGCRIENMVYVLENGYEDLTKSSTELFIVK